MFLAVEAVAMNRYILTMNVHRDLLLLTFASYNKIYSNAKYPQHTVWVVAVVPAVDRDAVEVAVVMRNCY
jgi:hypothetical protein